MASRGDVDLVDSYVRSRLEAVLGDSRRELQPQSMSVLCRDLQSLVSADSPELAFVATAVVALLAELLLAAPTGDIFPNEGSEPDDKAEASLWQVLRSLRNACFHPAAVKRGANPAHVDHLARLLQYRNGPLAHRLREDRTSLRSPRMLEMAIILLDELGRLYLERFRAP